MACFKNIKLLFLKHADVSNGHLQLIFGEMAARGKTRKQIYEFGYNLDKSNFAYEDKGIIRD